MSTPSRDQVEARRKAAAGQRRFVTALETFLKESEEAVSMLIAAGKLDDFGRVYAFQAGLINGCRMLLEPQLKEAELQAGLWERTAKSMAQEREADAQDWAEGLVEVEETIPRTEAARTAYVNTLMAGRTVGEARDAARETAA